VTGVADGALRQLAEPLGIEARIVGKSDPIRWRTTLLLRPPLLAAQSMLQLEYSTQ